MNCVPAPKTRSDRFRMRKRMVKSLVEERDVVLTILKKVDEELTSSGIK
jgi:hypothetical protein